MLGPMTVWSVYLIRTAGRALYTGIALDVEDRLRRHREGLGARSLRGRGPLRLVYARALGERGLALRVEHRIKRLTKAGKEDLVRSRPSRARLLADLGLPAPPPARAVRKTIPEGVDRPEPKEGRSGGRNGRSHPASR